ncbi:iron hydrogenase HydA [Gottschalkia purinilytica]|uniref:Iron hydrogenase HydA n=1 Tax=Gottschalkia purinilytica TaxID=1503 RepID=A0A0L0W6V1_GOTPU|nr:NAD(P)H-dependent oxidoreductase subunit E [Gottschalkia purinilytica]KNF07283.1 iron hydrogenase HydA [Gottschalkia purinilytica]
MEFTFDWEDNKENIKKLNGIIEDHKDKKGALMSVLHEAQDLFGYLPIEVQRIISEGLKVPLAEVYGVITFYSQFTLIPRGKYQIGICLGTACYVRGAQELVDKVKKDLSIEVGGTTSDRKFSLQATRCIGACGLAPVMSVNDEVYGRLKAEDIPEILEKYKNM